jgi:Fanconi anemia group M protein
MVFTQYRDTIESIAPVLEERGIRFERFIGQADRGKNRGMTQKEQKKTIGDFAAGRFNVLLASSIGEEGIDVPDVDLVVFYEPIPSEIRYIQRKGRTGRSSVGRVVIMVAENTRDEAFLRASSKREKKMKRIVRSMKGRDAG